MIHPRLVSLRPATPGDEPFLRQLFASTRLEFQFLGDPGQLEALLNMQFNLQRQQYEAGYPDAEDNIIFCDGQPVGRFFVSDGDQQFTLVDVALLPESRNLGIGRWLIEALLERAAAAQKPVRLHVSKMNPARRLYERLGFSVVDEDGMYFEMICEPAIEKRED
jgi:ribosomal protein S18 acetylase RimI-like enzyme